jgi:hypothetical protein
MRAAHRVVPPLLLAVVSSLVLAGCALQEPYSRPFTWAPTGVNEANLRGMVDDPHDLSAGRSSEYGLAVEAVPPVGRLLSGQRLPLSSASASGIGSSTSTNASSTPAGTNAAPQ